MKSQYLKKESVLLGPLHDGNDRGSVGNRVTMDLVVLLVHPEFQCLCLTHFVQETQIHVQVVILFRFKKTPMRVQMVLLGDGKCNC